MPKSYGCGVWRKHPLLKAQGVDNTIADNESKIMKDHSDWMLCPETFHQVNQRLEVDLFASRLTNQLLNFVSWRPDPMAMATDAFTLNWTEFRAYANPPRKLIGRILAQTRNRACVSGTSIEVTNMIPCATGKASAHTYHS